MTKKFLLSILFGISVLAIPVNADTPSPPFPNPVGVTQSNPTLLNADVLIVNPSPIPVTGTFNVSIPYSGPTATPAPSQTGLVGGVDGSGNLQSFQVNASKALKIDGSGVTQPVSGTFWQTTQPVSGTFFQSIQPVSQSGSWSNTCTQSTGANLHANIDNFPTTQPISGSISVSNFPATQAISAASPIPVSGTFWQTTQPVSGTFFQSTQPVSAASLPLPTGASTSALQTTGNTSLSSIVTNTANIPAQGQALAAGSMPVVLTSAQLSALVPLTTVSVNQGSAGGSAWPVSLTSVPLPTGGSTSALQTTGNTALTTINTTLGSPFQAGANIGNTSFGVSGTVAPLVYTNGSASNSAVIGSSSAITFSPPTHAVGFIIEAESGNTVNLRYACGTTATTTVGMLLEPGRDSGYVMSACTVTIIAVSSTAQSAGIQWVLSQ